MSAEGRTRRRLGGSFVVLLVIVALAASALAAVALTPVQRPDGLRHADPVRSAPATEQRFRDDRTVSVTMTVSADRPLPSPRSGVVTRATPTADVASGTSPLSIDSTPVLALFTTVPLYRDLGSGDRGDDVSALQTELTRIGHAVKATGTFDWATGSAVRALKKSVGFADPDRVLHRADVLWIPAESVAPSQWTAGWGTTAVAGEALGTIPGALTGIAITPRPSSLVAGSRSLTLWGQTGAVDAELRSSDPDFLGRLAATTDFPVVLAASKEDRKATGSLSLDAAIATVRVPAAAVFGVEGTRACIQAGGNALAVDVVGSALGATLVMLPDGTPAPSSVRLGAAITARNC